MTTLCDRVCALICACFASLAVATGASAGGGAKHGPNGGTGYVPPLPPPEKARIVHGRAVAPRAAPGRVKRVIAAANRLVGKPYRYGGGHGGWRDTGYDCSASVSYALHGGRFLSTPLASGALERWGLAGRGRWVTVYANAGHAYMVVAGRRFDTSMRDDSSRTGPGWSKRLRSPAAFTSRHPQSTG